METIADPSPEPPRRGATGDRSKEMGQKRQRSRVGNGNAFFPGDYKQTSVWARRCRELITDLVVDAGGAENCSAAEQSVIRRASALTVECERFEARFSQVPADQQVDLLELDLYRKLVNTLRLSLEALGLRRRMRDIDIVPPPDRFFSPLRQQLAERAAAADAVIDDDDGEAIS